MTVCLIRGGRTSEMSETDTRVDICMIASPTKKSYNVPARTLSHINYPHDVQPSSDMLSQLDKSIPALMAPQ